MINRKYKISKTDFLLSEMYTLKLKWDSVVYNNPGVCYLIGAMFYGPALQQASRINDNDFIRLDFFKQYYVHCKSVYIAELHWGKITYNGNGTVTLDSAYISHNKELNNVPQFKDDDKILIDTKNHEGTKHILSPNYCCYVVSSNEFLYNFVNPEINTYEVK